MNKRNSEIYLWSVWVETTRFGEWCLFELFLKKYKPNTGGTVISCVKKWSVAHYYCAPVSSKKKLKRKNCVCSIWNNVALASPTNFQPKNCGGVEIICPENDDELRKIWCCWCFKMMFQVYLLWWYSSGKRGWPSWRQWWGILLRLCQWQLQWQWFVAIRN